MPSYLTGNQFLLAYDARRVGELLSDTGTPIVSGSIPSDPVLIEMINQAESMVNLATRVGDRYQTSDLVSLAADAIAGGTLRRLVADLAWGLLNKRRGISASDLGTMAPGYGEALQTLELLRLGERIFDLPEAAEAGLPSVQKLGSDSPGQLVAKTRFFGCTSVNAGLRPNLGDGSNGCC